MSEIKEMLLVELMVKDFFVYCLNLVMICWNVYLCVFIDVLYGEVCCLYCGMCYKLCDGEVVKGY